MSGIYIPGMEMPESCGNCKLVQAFVLDKELVLYCPINGEPYSKTRKGCPLIHVPDHGRLIDANALLFAIPAPIEDEYKHVRRVIKDAPTVIEAEGGD